MNRGKRVGESGSVSEVTKIEAASLVVENMELRQSLGRARVEIEDLRATLATVGRIVATMGTVLRLVRERQGMDAPHPDPLPQGARGQEEDAA